MAGRSRDRQRVNRNAKSRAAAAAAAAARRAQRRRRGVAIIAAVGVVVIVVALSLAAIGGDDDGEILSTDSTIATVPAPSSASTTTPVVSAAGKPCVAVGDELPAGAPEVPVVVGPAPTELVVTEITPGTGAMVAATDTLTVHYIGVACSTGRIFDSSYERGEPSTFSLTGVIPGWQEGLTGMQVGGRRLLGIPSVQAYGAQGRPPDIAPDEALWFVVDVVDAAPA